MRNINHQHGGGLGAKFGFDDFQVILCQQIIPGESSAGMSISQRIGQSNLIEVVTKLEWSSIRPPFVAYAAVFASMLPFVSFFQLAENLLQRIFSNGLFCFR